MPASTADKASSLIRPLHTIMKEKIKIIFMGTPDFALAPLETLINHTDFEVVAVVTQEDKKVGRKLKIMAPPVKLMAMRHGIPVLQPQTIKNNPEFVKLLRSLQPDFLAVAAFGQILPEKILQIPKYGCVNIHASLLPKYRGASPIEEALLHGDQETGVTIIRMEQKLDSGNIYLLKKIPIENSDNAGTLRIKLSLLGAPMLPEVLTEIVETGTNGIPQNEKLATYCHKIEKKNGLMDIKSMSAEEILRRIKAYTPWPGCAIMLKGKKLKILEAEIDKQKNIEPGQTIPWNKNKIALGTKKGLLMPLKVQLEGKNALPIENFLLGNRQLF